MLTCSCDKCSSSDEFGGVITATNFFCDDCLKELIRKERSSAVESYKKKIVGIDRRKMSDSIKKEITEKVALGIVQDMGYVIGKKI
jgi:hypothetical protein